MNENQSGKAAFHIRTLLYIVAAAAFFVAAKLALGNGPFGLGWMEAYVYGFTVWIALWWNGRIPNIF